MSFKLGKKPAQHRPTDLLFESFLVKGQPIPVPPRTFGHQDVFSKNDWLMLGNGPDDTVEPGFQGCGDCVWAGMAHQAMLWNKVAKNVTVPFTGKAVVSDYSAGTGYVLDDPDTDQGTDVHVGLDYARATGVVDANGTRHKIGGYVSIEPGNWQQVLQALYVFEIVGVGFNVPDYAMSEFPGIWRVRSGGQIVGGHYVCLTGFTMTGGYGPYMDPISWGTQVEMTKAFFERYCDEAYGILSLEDLNTQGKTVEGFDLAQLQADIVAL